MSLAGKRLLAVEDEPIIGFALEDMLMAEGAETTFASSLEQAMELAQGGEFDAAVLDVNLHGQESYGLARDLLRRGVNVIFATGYGEGTRPADLDHVPTVPKPYNIASIRSALGI